jgi:hypothetical protein
MEGLALALNESGVWRFPMNLQKTLKVVLWVAVGFSSLSAQASCYNPLNEQEIINQCPGGRNLLNRLSPHLQRARVNLNLDPRLLFHRMVGESRCNPDIRQIGGGTGFGLFQFDGSFTVQQFRSLNSPWLNSCVSGASGARITHRVVLACLARQDGATSVEDRIVLQTRYYIDVYAKLTAEWLKTANRRLQCPAWRSMSSMQMLSVLGHGVGHRIVPTCAAAVARENTILNGARAHGSYRVGIISSVPGIVTANDVSDKPLCTSWASIEPSDEEASFELEATDTQGVGVVQ